MAASAADVAALMQQVQQMQQQLLDLQTAANTQQAQLNDQSTLARDHVVTLKGNLQRLDHTNQQLLNERKREHGCFARPPCCPREVVERRF